MQNCKKIPEERLLTVGRLSLISEKTLYTQPAVQFSRSRGKKKSRKADSTEYSSTVDSHLKRLLFRGSTAAASFPTIIQPLLLSLSPFVL